MIDHVSIKVSDLEKSRRFYEKAFAPLGWKVSFGKEKVFYAFGIGNGAPGPRPNYTEGYYACFILDPDGHNIEAMFDLWTG